MPNGSFPSLTDGTERDSSANKAEFSDHILTTHERAREVVVRGAVNPFSHKPAFGDPCNGCGACCIITQCVVSQAVFGEQEICPALERAGQAFACGLMINTANYVPDVTAWGGKALTETFTLMIGAGIGCDGTLDHEPEPNETARSAMRRRAEVKIAGASPQARSLVDYFRSPTPGASHV